MLIGNCYKSLAVRRYERQGLLLYTRAESFFHPMKVEAIYGESLKLVKFTQTLRMAFLHFYTEKICENKNSSNIKW
jgi:hypothetical protein